MVKIETYKAEHLDTLIKEDANTYLKRLTTFQQMKDLEKSTAFTAIGSDGRIIACAGVVELWHGRAEAWAVLHSDCKREFLGVHNAVKRFLESCPIRRIEAAVALGFHAGHRWANQLGFQLECPRLRSYSPEGADMALYVRIR